MQALDSLDERALPEWAAFAATLARRLAALLPKQQVTLGDPVWKACVDSFLLKAVDIDSQVSGGTILYVCFVQPAMRIVCDAQQPRVRSK